MENQTQNASEDARPDVACSAPLGRVYLAGPMTGLPALNYPAFAERTAALRAMGHEVVSPAEDADVETTMAWHEWMRRDIKLLVDCEAVVCLPGWEHSRGATLEVHIARALGMDVLCAHTLTPIAAPDQAA